MEILATTTGPPPLYSVASLSPLRSARDALSLLCEGAARDAAASRELRVVALVVPADSAAIRRATDCAIGKPVFTTLYASESLPAAGLRRETRLELFHDADAATLWLRVVLAECAASDVVATDGFASTPGAATRAERDCCARHPHWREWPDERVELRMQMWRAWRAEQRASDRRARRAHETERASRSAELAALLLAFASADVLLVLSAQSSRESGAPTEAQHRDAAAVDARVNTAFMRKLGIVRGIRRQLAPICTALRLPASGGGGAQTSRSRQRRKKSAQTRRAYAVATPTLRFVHAVVAPPPKESSERYAAWAVALTTQEKAFNGQLNSLLGKGKEGKGKQGKRSKKKGGGGGGSAGAGAAVTEIATPPLYSLCALGGPPGRREPTGATSKKKKKSFKNRVASIIHVPPTRTMNLVERAAGIDAVERSANAVVDSFGHWYVRYFLFIVLHFAYIYFSLTSLSYPSIQPQRCAAVAPPRHGSHR